MDLAGIVVGATASLLGGLLAAGAAIIAVRMESHRAVEMAQRERSADSALRLLHALDAYTLSIERRAPSGYQRSSKWPIDEDVIRQLDVAVRTEGAALASSDLRFMAHQTVEVGRLYVQHRNLDDWEWGPLEEAQALALEYLHDALGRHVRGLEVRPWAIIPYQDLELLMEWRAPDMQPG